jgi:hypothetical protein
MLKSKFVNKLSFYSVITGCSFCVLSEHVCHIPGVKELCYHLKQLGSNSSHWNCHHHYRKGKECPEISRNIVYNSTALAFNLINYISTFIVQAKTWMLGHMFLNCSWGFWESYGKNKIKLCNACSPVLQNSFPWKESVRCFTSGLCFKMSVMKVFVVTLQAPSLFTKTAFLSYC